MSFFGFDATLPRDRAHQKSAPGFAAHEDAFAGLSGSGNADDGPIDFEETYDGYGGQLDDTLDNLNDDTFGEAPATQQDVGKDFDFSGQTGGVAQAFEEERMRWAVQHGSSQPKQAKPRRTDYKTGYENVPQLEADADLWGIAPKKQEEPKLAASSRKGLTLEEVEAMMLAQGKPPAGPGPQADDSQMPPFPNQFQQAQFQQPFRPSPPPAGYAQPPQILQRPPQGQQPPPEHVQRGPPEAQSYGAHHPPQILQRQQRHPSQSDTQQAPTGPRQPQHRQPPTGPSHGGQPRQILQNPNRLSGHGQPLAPHQSGPQSRQGHARGPSYSGPIITNPNQILHLSEDDRIAYLQEEARRAKRNHKIHLLSKYNGLMTPQDKNFITRIQLQQLVTATGTVDAEGPESLLNEDFYYQVYTQIRGAPRQNPHQPANQFAQTYLFQTGGRYGQNRRNARGAENHMQRMEQQVQRAVEAARAKPKNSQLVIEGSLGKISFSNAKTPKPLLNIKRPEGESRPNVSTKRSSRHHDAAAERRETWKNIESVYSILMEAEDHLRQEPRETGPEFDDWALAYGASRERLWRAIKADVPINENPSIQHPFIAILSHAKGKKAIPRAWRHFPPRERTIIITIIIVHLDSLDVVHNALASPIPASVKEDVEVFSQTVIPVIFGRINEEELHVVLGLLGLILDRTDIRSSIRTKTGLLILTTLVSRAEIIKQEDASSSSQSQERQQLWQQYASTYTALFNAIEPILPHIFPDANPLASDDVYVWQFLAAMGAAANAEQQQRLVIGVKDRVMSAVTAARTLPTSEMERRKGEVNLFMRALGLDVDLLV